MKSARKGGRGPSDKQGGDATGFEDRRDRSDLGFRKNTFAE